MNSIEDREKAEIVYWKNSEHENPDSDSVYNLINKMGDCAVFLDVIQNYSSIFHSSRSVIEIGGGQGWASCVLKRTFPHLKVVLTDISQFAIQSKSKWEKIFGVSLDNAYACKSYAIPEPDSSFDCVFCFAAAHHFADHQQTFGEIHRILKRGGYCLYLHEPATSKLFYKWASDRVNRKRPIVPEDVILYRSLLRIAETSGLTGSVHFDPIIIKRGPLETIYYYALSKLTFLQKFLPCTANFVFVKK